MHDLLYVDVRRPSTMVLEAEDTNLTRKSCNAIITYQLLRWSYMQMVWMHSPCVEFVSSDTSVATVDSTGRVHGVSPGVTSVYINGLPATVSISVSDGTIPRRWCQESSLHSSEGIQEFNDENDVGYMYVYATYENGDKHELDPSELNVIVYDSTRVDYSLNDRHRIAVVQDALAGDSCTDSLMTVGLASCVSRRWNRPCASTPPFCTRCRSNCRPARWACRVHLHDPTH